MKTTGFKNNYLTVLFLVFFIVFAISTLIDAQARILISDPALYFFKIISSKNLFIPAERLTSIINQPLLVLGVHAKLPLNYLLGIYSLSFLLVRALYYFLAAHIFKCKSAGYAVIFISVIGVAESYFRPTSESTIALLNSILFYAWLCYANRKQLDKNKLGEVFEFFVSALFVLFGYYSHPIALFSLIFVIVYFTIDQNKYFKFYPYLTIGFTLFLFLSKIFKASETSTHHGELYSNVLSNPFSIFYEISGYYPYKFFWDRYDNLFLPLILLAVFAFILLLTNRKWFVSLFFVGYIVFYFIVICISFKEGESNMQMEKLFLPISFFSGLVFMEYFILKLKKSYIGAIILLVFLGYGFMQIEKARPKYHDRIDYLKNIVDVASKKENQKFILPVDSINKPRMIFHWASGIETLLLSSMNDSIKPLTVFISNNPANFEEEMNTKDNFICAPFHSFWSYNRLNPDYFVLPGEKYMYLDENFK